MQSGVVTPTEGYVRSTVPLVADAAVVGIALLAATVATIVGVIAKGEVVWWLAAALCLLGIGASVFQFRYTGVDEDVLTSASPIGGSSVDPLWRLPLRNLPTLLVATLFIAASAIFAREALTGSAGLIAGRALMELRLALLYRRWEYQHGRKLYGTTGRFRPILQRTHFQEIYVGP
jgi:hypothetical protein